MIIKKMTNVRPRITQRSTDDQKKLINWSSNLADSILKFQLEELAWHSEKNFAEAIAAQAREKVREPSKHLATSGDAQRK